MAGSVTVHIDIDEVLDELSDHDLLEAVEDRGLSFGAMVSKGVFTARDMQDMKDAALTGRAFDLLIIVQAALCPSRSHDQIAATYAALPRDAESGRPVIQ